MNKLLVFTFLLCGALLVTSVTNAGWCNKKYTVKGKLKIYNDMTTLDPGYEPVKGIKVRIYNGAFHIKTTSTKSDGSFSKTFTSCSSRLNLKVGFVPTTSKVNVAQLMIRNYYKIKPSKTFKNARPGTYNFNTFYYGKRDTKSGRRLKVYHTIMKTLDWLKDDHGINFINSPGVPTGHIEVGYPSLTPNDTSWYTPFTRLINLKGSDFQPTRKFADVLVHEFGHLFQNGYGKWYLNIPNYSGDGGWSHYSLETPEVANLEGFATFIEYLFFAEHGFEGIEDKIESRFTKAHLKDGGASNHATFFYDLYDANEDEDKSCHVDRCELSLKEIMTVFAASSRDGLKAFSIANDNMDDFVDRYYEIFGNPPGDCDFDELMFLNKLKENPNGDACE